MKVMYISKQPRMIETQIKPASNLKRIQNYVFDLNNIIGVGNFSKVYRGKNQLTNQTCAIKVIEMEIMKTPALIKLLESQCQIIKALNILIFLNCIQIFTSKNNCYIVTEICNEGDLETLIRNKGPFNQKFARKIIYDAYSGLKYLNELKIVHRDFKVANIFMDNGIAKIADFGFAKKLRFSDQNFNDINIGSPIYMSPQSILNNRYGPKTDVWAFGIFLFEILHGDTPLYYCKSQTDLKANIGIPTNQSALNPYLSQNLKNLILRCLQVNQTKRISMKQMSNHPYIIQLKSQFQLKAQNICLKISECTTSSQHRQVIDKIQKPNMVIKKKVQPTLISIPFSQKHNFDSQNLMNNTRSLFSEQFITKSPQQVILNKNVQPINLVSNQRRISVKDFSLNSLSIPHLSVSSNKTEIMKSINKHKIEQQTKLQLSHNGSHSQIQPTCFINQQLTFIQCVNILHYCRLIYKFITLTLKSKCYLNSMNIFAIFLLCFMKQIQSKQNQIKYDGDRAAVRQEKLKDVINEYSQKYQKQLIHLCNGLIPISPLVINQKIKQQILTAFKTLQKQQFGNEQLIKVLIYLDILRESTTLLITCIDKQDFNIFGTIKIEDFLKEKIDTKNINFQNIKAHAL